MLDQLEGLSPETIDKILAVTSGLVAPEAGAAEEGEATEEAAEEGEAAEDEAVEAQPEGEAEEEKSAGEE